MTSVLFREDILGNIEAEVVNLFAAPRDILGEYTQESPRAAGDAIQQFLGEKLRFVLGDLCRDYSAAFARRAMADIAFRTRDGYYCIVDVKSHRVDASFSMPQLTSVERLARLYEDDSNIFCLLMVKYRVESKNLRVERALFLPIEWLDWTCLVIGALGWGQIQIANSAHIKINRELSRKQWMLQFCDNVLAFYPREIAKIGERMRRFEELREFWRNKPER